MQYNGIQQFAHKKNPDLQMHKNVLLRAWTFIFLIALNEGKNR